MFGFLPSTSVCISLTPYQFTDVENRFRRANIQVMTGCRVQELREKEVIVLDKRSNTVKQIPYGVCVWSTGIAPHELTKKLQSKIESQVSRSSINPSKNL